MMYLSMIFYNYFLFFAIFQILEQMLTNPLHIQKQNKLHQKHSLKYLISINIILKSFSDFIAITSTFYNRAITNKCTYKLNKDELLKLL